ncbi:MAG: 50S ribosomal protein L22 [Acidimicrobiia bacterium]|nr:50S ribosomal protein L22 [Acidimicrobiia bacterium]
MADTTALARVRYLRTAPSKVRQVLDLIRGEDVEVARDILERTDRGATGPVLKLLDSAVANAEAKLAVPEEELVIDEAFADEGPILKRWRPRARGRAARINKRTSHVTIVLARLDEDDLARKSESETSEGAARRRSLRRRRVEAAQAASDKETEEIEETEETDTEIDDADDESAGGGE